MAYACSSERVQDEELRVISPSTRAVPNATVACILMGATSLCPLSTIEIVLSFFSNAFYCIDRLDYYRSLSTDERERTGELLVEPPIQHLNEQASSHVRSRSFVLLMTQASYLF